MEKGYHNGQELTMAKLGMSLEELSNQPLEIPKEMITESGNTGKELHAASQARE